MPPVGAACALPQLAHKTIFHGGPKMASIVPQPMHWSTIIRWVTIYLVPISWGQSLASMPVVLWKCEMLQVFQPSRGAEKGFSGLKAGHIH